MYKVTLPDCDVEITSTPFCGKNPNGDVLTVNSRYIAINGKPWLPVSGEFHYARYKREDWERELCKMKACGVDLIATYVFWIHHEEIEGQFDFEGQRDVRAFVELCRKNGLKVLLRIGPWCHGECRNGGFPDFIQHQNKFKFRTNDPTYLRYVERFFDKLGEQVKGLMWKDGGPVVGIQIENEYEPYAEPDRERRHDHMRTLKELAIKAGFITPLYTATVWGYASLIELEELPVSGGYADAAWDASTAELKESGNYLMNHSMNDPTIGADLRKDHENATQYDVDVRLTPYLTAEMGGGMQMTKHRRVVIDALDTEAITVSKLGSGAALVGYYMFHGGTNPDGKLTTMEESTSSGSPWDLPVKSYDFQGVLRENGDAHPSFDRLRRRHLMLNEWGDKIAAAFAFIPDDSAKAANDFKTLRYSVRHDFNNGSGFIFINNHVRLRHLAYHKDVRFELNFGGKTLVTPPVNVANDQMAVLPYNLDLGGKKLISTNATPLTRLGDRYFFFTDDKPVYNFENDGAEIITLTNEQSLRTFKLGERVFVADSPCVLYELDGRIYAEYYGEVRLTVYEKTGNPYEIILPETKASAPCFIMPEGDKTYRIDIEYPVGCDAEPMLVIEYNGDTAEVYDASRPDKLLSDWFTCGLEYKLSLNQFNRPKSLLVKLTDFDPNRYFDLPVKPGCEVTGAHVELRTKKEIDSLLK